MLQRELITTKLNTRARSVIDAKEENFYNEVKIFFNFMDNEIILKNIKEEIENIEFDLGKYEKEVGYVRFIPFPNNIDKKIAMCYSIMKKFSNGELNILNTMFMHVGPMSNIDDKTREIAEQYFTPLYEYINEKIEDNNTMLSLLSRYKFKTEWFSQKKLYQKYMDDKKAGETILTLDLQEFLFIEGIDYPFSSPLSPSGRSDMLGMIESNNPLVLEVKIFNTDQGYDKGYLRKGLTQAYRYACDYDKPVGYLLVFNADEKDISFEGNEETKKVVIGNKTIYIIVVKIYNEVSASKQRKPLPYVIEDVYLKNTT